MSEVLAGQVLHLQWKAYTSTWGPVLRDLRAAGLFHDLTLVTSDNQLVTAHKIVLAACSQFFRGLLASLPMQTTGPLSPAVLYMRGVSGAALLKLLDFMYNGEVNVEHQLLKEFLQVGEELRVQGLCEELAEKDEKVEGRQEYNSKDKDCKDKEGNLSKIRHRSHSGKDRLAQSEKHEKRRKHSQKEILTGFNEMSAQNKISSNRKEDRKSVKREREIDDVISAKSEADLVPNPSEETDTGTDHEDKMLDKDRTRTPTPRKKIRKLKSLEELKDDAINRDVLTMDPGEAHGILKLIENLNNIEENSEDLNIYVQLLNQLILKSNIANNVLYFCGICQKSLKSKQHILNHVEANHVSGVYHVCAECGMKMKTRSSLFSHKNKNHKIHKKEDLKVDQTTVKTDLPSLSESIQTKVDPVQNRPDYIHRSIEDVQNNFNNIHMVDNMDSHSLEEAFNNYSSETEYD